MFSGSTPRRDSILLLALALCACLLIGKILYLYANNPEHFPIRHIKIASSYTAFPREQIVPVIQNAINQHSFLTMNAASLAETLSNITWIDDVHITRSWPDTLKITLVAKKPLVRWRKAFLTEQGDLFSSDQYTLSDYPELHGNENQRKEILHVYKKMSKILYQYSFTIAHLKQQGQHTWEVQLHNGITLLLGHHDIAARLTQFCKAYPVIFDKTPERRAQVDLRYPQGMAIAWEATDTKIQK